MPPHERKIIHTTLQSKAGVSTHSEGQEPYRKVAIVAE
ncbi:MAG: R3H domain-containing nucleic acid-binding protein [Halanaerobacter sp.]